MKAKLAALIPAAAALLSGCEATELGNRAIIQAAAVDYESGEYTVSALLFSAGGGSGGEIDPSNDNVIKITGTGETFAQAVDDISLTDGKELYFSENRLLILGGGFADTDVSPMLEALTRDLRCSLNMLVCYSDDPELLTDLRFTEGITAAEKPTDMIENAYNSGSAPRAFLLDLLNDTAAGRETLLPMFTAEENGFGTTADDSGMTAVISGARVLSDGRLAERLDSTEAVGAMLLQGQSDHIILTFEHGGAEHSCEAYCIKSERLENGKIRVSAKLRRRNGSPLPDEIKNAALSRLEEIISAAL